MKHEGMQTSVEGFYTEEETKLRAIFDSSPDAITVIDLNGNITECNQATLDMLSYSSKDEVIGKNGFALVAKKDRERAREDLKVLLEQGSMKNIEYTVLTKDGCELPVELSASVIKDSSGNPIGFVAITKDITERKRIRTSEESYRSLVELAPDSIMTFDLKGVITSCNTASARLSGYSKDELVGKHFAKIGVLRARDLSKYLKMLNSILRGKVPKPFEVIWQHKNGTPHFGEVRLSLMREKGKIVGIQAIMRDITERKMMEEKLRQYSEHLEELVQKRTEELLELEKRYSVLVEEARDGVALIQDGKIVFTNKRGPELIGYSRDELIGLPFEKLVSEEYSQLTRERYERRLQGENVPATYEIDLIAKNGGLIPVELSATRIHYQGLPADLIIVRDIKERKRMEEQRLKLEKLATIGELATMVGHDLRNPLQSIENATYYLKNELSGISPSVPIPQKAKEMLQVLNDSVNYADKIIRDLQDFSATKKPILKKTNINAIVKETLSQVREFRKLDKLENVEFITKLGRLPEIKADKDMIKRVFLNLAVNGMQAMENGGTLTVSTKKADGFVEVSFKDTGIGMSKENLEKIFTPFFTTRAKGMGMGLPICKKFVESHGGSIKVESEEGKRTTFTVKLPIQQENGGEKQ